LMYYLLAKEYTRSQAIQIRTFLFRRVLRILPAYYLAFVIYCIVVYALGLSDSRWCKKWFWSNLLFINNIVTPYGEYCMGWSWSLAVEMQMYLVSPFLVIMLLRYEKRGPRTMVGLILASFLLTIGIGLLIALTSTGEETNALYGEWIYIKPYTRMPPYLMGMLAAHYVRLESSKNAAISEGEMSDKEKYDYTWVKALFATLGILGVAFTTQVTPPVDPFIVLAAETILGRYFLSLGVAYIMYLLLVPKVLQFRNIVSENAYKWLRTILSSRPMYIIAQVSYGMYLLHLINILAVYETYPDFFLQFDCSFFPTILILYIVFVFVTFAQAVVMFVFVEKPLMNLR